MSSNQSHFRVHGVIVLVLFLGLAFNFNNCGRTPSVEGSDLPNRSLDARMRTLKTVHEGQLPIGFCAKGTNYECLHKVFSKTAEYQEWPSTPQCLTGSPLCASVRTRSYNSGELARECPQCETDYDEYECHVKLADTSGLYPVVVTDRSFDGAIRQVQALCETVGGRK